MTKNKTILVTGGEGLLASKLKELSDNNWVFKSKASLNILSAIQIDRAIDKHKPDTIFHAAALTKPMVLHEESPDISIYNNIIGTSLVALACIKYNIKMVYVSTDWVYTGTKGMYSEEDGCAPTTNYGWSKLGGECAVNMVQNFLIFRAAMTPKPFPHESAFNDCIKSSMYIDEAAKIMKEAVDKDLTGVYNLGGEAQTIYDFAKKEMPNIGSSSRSVVSSINIPEDTSMDCTKIYRKISWKK